MKSIYKKLLSLIVVISMMVPLVPNYAFAASSTCPHARAHEALDKNPKNETLLDEGWVEEYWSISNEQAQDCTHANSYDLVCIECGYSIRYTDPNLPALGHDFGEWDTHIEPTCTEKGIEIRTCSRCYEQDTRDIPMIEHDWNGWHLIPGDDKGTEQRECKICGETEKRESEEKDPEETRGYMELLVLQVLLTDYGTYTGPTDGNPSEALSEAIKAYEKSHGMKETGLSSDAIFGKLVDDLLLDKNPDFSKYVNKWPDADYLRGVAQGTADAVSNGDGTHDATYYVNSVLFISDSGEIEYKAATYNRAIPGDTDPCFLGNPEHTCAYCGYQGKIELNPDFLNKLGAGATGILNWPPASENWATIENLTNLIDTYAFKWKAFPDADSYTVVLYKGEELKKIECVETFIDLEPILADYPGGVYSIAVYATKGGEQISNPQGMFFIYKKQVHSPSFIAVIGDKIIIVPYCELPENCYYAVFLRDEATGNVLEYAKTTNTEINVNEIQETFDNEPVTYTDSMVACVRIESTTGEYYASEETTSLPFSLKNNTYYTVQKPCNVRAEASTQSDRVGGLSEGTVICAIEEKSGFLKFYFGDRYAWVLKSLCVPCESHFYKITFDPLSKGVGAEYAYTKASGQLSADAFSAMYYLFKDCKPGYVFDGWYTGGGEAGVELDSEYKFSSDYNLYAHWVRDEHMAEIKCYDINGKEITNSVISRLYAYKGTSIYNDLPLCLADVGRIEWRTAEGELVTETTVIPENAGDTYEVYAYKCSDTYFRLRRDAVLRTSSDPYSSIITVLTKGTEVKVIERVSDTYKVECDGQKGFITIADIIHNEVTLTFKTNGGWCEVKQLTLPVNDEWTIADTLPVPTRDGYIFNGWEVHSNSNTGSAGTVINGADKYKFLENSTLVAKWVECFDTYEEALLISDRYWHNDIDIYPDKENRKEFITVQIQIVYVLEREDGWCRILTTNGETGWVREKLICTNYYEASISHYSPRIVLSAKVKDLNRGINAETGHTLFLYNPDVRGYYHQKVYVIDESSDGCYIVSDHINGNGGWIHKAALEDRSCRVTFDVNGGALLNGNSTVQFYEPGQPYGVMPMATKKGCTFTGWYTEPIGGKLVTPTEIPYSSVRLFAHFNGEANGLYASNGLRYAYVDEGLTTKKIRLKEGIVVQGSEIYEYNGKQIIRIRYNGEALYISADNIAHVDRYRVSLGRLQTGTVREEPNKDSKKVGNVKSGEEVFVVGEENGWYEICWPGRTSYVYMHKDSAILSK